MRETTKRGRCWTHAIGIALALLAAAPVARAEVKEVRIARQLGLGYLQLYVMQENKLIEKHAQAAGLGEIGVRYQPIASPATMNDMLVSGNVDMVGCGFPPFLVIWDRTRGGLEVRNVAALNVQPLILNTNNPNIRSLKDFTDKDRIAVPAVKVSTQAIYLQMAAEKLYGLGRHEELDKYTVGLGHPEATTALLSGRSEVTAHFASAPFLYQQLENPGIRRVYHSYESTDGPSTTTNFWTTAKFRADNPKTYAAIFAALEEANAFILADKAEAARIYIKIEGSRLPPATVERMVADPEMIWSLQPQNTMKVAEFLHRIGRLKNKPRAWTDYFFPEVHGRPGS